MTDSVWIGADSNTTHVDEVIPPLLYEFEDAPDGMVADFVSATVREIIASIGGIKYSASIQVYCGVNDYNIPVPDCMLPLAVEDVEADWSLGKVRFEVELEASQIIFPNIPKDSKVLVHLRLQIPRGSCDIPSFLVERYEDLILDGTRARIYRLGNMPWSDLRKADYFNEAFNDGLGELAVSQAMQGKNQTLFVNFGRVV